MKNLKTLILAGVTVASMAACNPKPHHEEGREEIKKDLIDVIVAGEINEDGVHMKNFNQAILNHDMEGALYNLAGAYLSRSIYLPKTDKSHDAMKLEQNAYGLLPEIKEFSVMFGSDEDMQKISDMIQGGEFGFGNNTIGSTMQTILNWSESLRKEKAEK